MRKTEELDALFDRWCREFPRLQGKFAKDGIICESIYEKQDLKLLFLAKEPNDPRQNEFDFRDWWSREVKYSFTRRICEWAYGLLNHFPPLTDLPSGDKEQINIMRAIAFMNLKKTGGGATADHRSIREAIIEQKHLILQEISIINPDIIIGGIPKADYWRLLFPNIQFRNSGFDIGVSRIDSWRIIAFYHPSYRVPRAMSYCLLDRVVSSHVFSNL